MNEDIKCSKIAKQLKKDILVVLRCGAVEYVAEELMKKEKTIDVVFYGETDFTLYELLANADKNKIKGVFYRENIKIVKTAKRPFLEDMESLPIVDRSLIKNKLYIRPDNGKPLGLIETSRGCPYSCIFCLTPYTYGHLHRRRRVSSIIKEIRICVEDYGILDFHFKSDIFSFNKEWIIELCNEIMKNNLKIRWFANSRVDSIDDNLLKVMKKSGCFALAIGVESGSKYILNKIKKNITLEGIEKAFLSCKKNKIRTYAYFIIGFPWDTKYTVTETVKLCKKIDPDYIDFFYPFAFQGTELYKIIKDLGLIKNEVVENIRRKSYIGFQFPTLTLSKEELNKLRREALKSFYFRPRYVLRTFRQCKTLGEVFRIFGYGVSLMKKIVN